MFSLSNLFGFLVAVAVLGVLIFVHELGHFLVAKSMNFCVLKFSLGFGKKLFGRVKGETEYLLSAIPLGGYVKFYGENAMGDEEEVDELSNEEKARVAGIDESRNFAKFHPLKRILTVVAGPMFNLIFAAFLFSLIFMMGFTIPNTRIGEVSKGDPAELAGLKSGDLILEIDGKKAENWEDVHRFISTSEGETIALSVNRDGNTIEFTVNPKIVTEKDVLGEEASWRLIGIVNSQELEDMIETNFGILESTKLGVMQTIDYSILTYKGIIKLILRKIPLRENLGGPIMIVQKTGEFAQKGILHLLNFMAIISISLGVINLMPIPILDGGAIIFFLIEFIKGKPISLKKRILAQQVGLFLLVALMLFAIYNDIARLIAS